MESNLGSCGFWFLLAVLKWVWVEMDFCFIFAGFDGVSCECKVFCFSYDSGFDGSLLLRLLFIMMTTMMKRPMVWFIMI